jgi:hypothetical protein
MRGSWRGEMALEAGGGVAEIVRPRTSSGFPSGGFNT